MLRIPEPPTSSTASNSVDVVDLTDPPRALELILRFIYPSIDVSIIKNLTVLLEALILADKYDIEVARVRLRSSLRKFTVTEPLRAYAVACRLGFGEEKQIAPWHTAFVHLPGLDELPEEFNHIPATEYHCLILLHSRYRKEITGISSRTPLTIHGFREFADTLSPSRGARERLKMKQAVRSRFMAHIDEGVRLIYESLALAWKVDNGSAIISDGDTRLYVSSVLSQANTLNLTV